MNLYLITQDVNKDYDTFKGAVVTAETEEQARYIHPSAYNLWSHEEQKWYIVANDGRKLYHDEDDSWCEPRDVKVQYLGEAAMKNTTKKVILSSFFAG